MQESGGERGGALRGQEVRGRRGVEGERVAVCLSVRVCFRERFSILLPSPPVLPLFVSCREEAETEAFRHEPLLWCFSQVKQLVSTGEARNECRGRGGGSTLSQRVRQKEVRLD